LVTVARALVVVALLAMPLLVVANLPRLFELAGSVPPLDSTPVALATPFRLPDPTPPPSKPRFAPLDEAPPPTLVPAPTVVRQPTPIGERVFVTNTGGIGAVLRAEPVSGRPVASLREQVELTVLERRTVSNREWLRVRTTDGQEGWVLGLVARPVTQVRQ
jgi:hypothetical protein